MSGGHDYTGHLEYIREELNNVRSDLKDLTSTAAEHSRQLAAINQHLSALNGSVLRNEGDISALEGAIGKVRVRAAEDRAENKGATDFVGRIKDNWWGILQAILIAVILAKVVPT